jgi:hypothetical protein
MQALFRQNCYVIITKYEHQTGPVDVQQLH